MWKCKNVAFLNKMEKSKKKCSLTPTYPFLNTFEGMESHKDVSQDVPTIPGVIEIFVEFFK